MRSSISSRRSPSPVRWGRRCLGGILLALWAGSPAGASDVLAGSDLFTTPASPFAGSSPSQQSLSLPADLFGAGSDPFVGTVHFRGVPLAGTNTQGADTIVARLEDAILPGCGSVTVPPISIQILALSLVGTDPITVTFGALGSSTYEVRAGLSSLVAQTPGSMTLTHSCPQGGVFSSSLPVTPRLVFTRLSGSQGLASLTLDPAPSIEIDASGVRWSHTDGGTGALTAPSGGTADHDADPATPPVPFPATTNFFAGIGSVQCACDPGSASAPICRLSQEEEKQARHGILPPLPQPPPDRDADGIPDRCDNCEFRFNPEQEDDDDDGLGNACGVVAVVPALDDRGRGVLLGLLALAGLALLRRRRATPAG